MSSLNETRRPGPIEPGAEVALVLAEHRAIAGIESSGELDIEAVRNAERGVGIRFEDDLLAVFAANVPMFSVEREMRLPLVVGHTGALREAGAPGDLIGVGREADGTCICVPMRARDGSGTVLHFFDPTSKRVERRVPLLEWLRGALGERSAADVEPFSPALVAPLLESQSGVRVHHAVFGEGRVLTETGSGPERKVKVDFPRVGLKLLQARFLEWPDETG